MSPTQQGQAAIPDEARVIRLEAEFAEVCGLINAAHGRMVELLGEALDDELWKGWQIHSPAHWTAWQAGMTAGRANGLARLAARRHELPATVAALTAGDLSVDAAVAIGRLAPAGFDESITEFAKAATIPQLLRTLRDYHYDDPDADGPKSKGEDHRRGVSIGSDEDTGWLNANLPLDEHSIVTQALKAARDDLYRQACDGLAPEAPQPQITWADALIAMAEASLRAGEAAHPGSDRYLVHLHLNATPTPDDPTGTLSIHLGPNLPAPLRDLLLCDTQLRPVFEVHGQPVALGRKTRTISRRLRRLIEHRDGGCAVPGCGQTHGLDIHHIVHWEHQGATDPDNLIALCRRHHRLHHLGQLGIAGNPTMPADHPDSLRFTDAWGRPVRPAGTPTAPDDARPLNDTAADQRIRPGRYAHPLGERLDRSAVSLPANRRRTVAAEPPSPPATDDDQPSVEPLAPPHAPVVTATNRATEHHRTTAGTRGDPA